jgi:hypothetical protein
MQPLQKVNSWDSLELATGASVALGTSKNKVPDPIDIQIWKLRGKNVREKMIYISKAIGNTVIDNDVTKAIETLALLVAIKRIPAAGYVYPAELIPMGKQNVIIIVVSNLEQVRSDIERPCRLNEPPTCLYLEGQVRELDLFL